MDHRRNFQEFYAGQACEHITVATASDSSELLLEHAVEPSRVHDDLRAAVWVRANRPGILLAMRVRLPHQVDPVTKGPAVLEVRGAAYTQTGRWEQLTVAASDVAVEQQLVLLRGRLATVLEGRTVDTRDATVDQVALIVPLGRGVTEILIDELEAGPLVRFHETPGESRNPAPAGPRPECPVRVGPNSLLVNGKPFFPRFAAYHGENLDVLREMGLNVILIERYEEQILIDELARRDIWVMAPPPRPPDTPLEDVVHVGLMPIPPSTERVLFWMVGTRIRGHELKAVERWIDQIRDADRAFTQPRPIMADVISEERSFSRSVSLIGSSRHILHTSFSPLQYRDYLTHKKHLALPDRFAFTWIQTEPAEPNVLTRHPSRDRPIHVEAEQIWMQAWAAVSVGHRAMGFWKSTPFDDESPAARERRLAIALLNAQLDLLQPWLATGKLVETIPVHLAGPGPSTPDRIGSRFLPSLRGTRGATQTVHPEIHAAVIESDYGRLVIPLWYGSGAQFQPGPMVAQNVSFVVRGGEQARAWEVSTTSVQPLDLNQPVPGGMEFRLPMIDQFAFVVITNDLQLEALLSQRVRSMQPRCARLWVELARTRYERVRLTHEELQRVARVKVQEGDALLRSVALQLEQAEGQLEAQHYDEARRLSRKALQLLRTLQRTHWENAIAELTSPVSSPHTVCFETLPDHWKMVAAIGRSVSGSSENLLRSGDFEDYDTVRADGWDGETTPAREGDVRSVELHTDAFEGRYALRLVSRTLPDQPVTSALPNVHYWSPAVPVQGGQTVIISGRVRVQQPLTGHPDGFMVYDNIKGTVGALRWYEQTPRGQWHSFRLIREVLRTQDVQLHFEINGDGDVRVDDLRIVALSPAATAGAFEHPDRPRRNLLDFAPPFPKVRLWPGRDTEESTP